MTSDRSPNQGAPTSEISPDQEDPTKWPAFRKLMTDCCGDLKLQAIADAAGIKVTKLYNLFRRDRKEPLADEDMQALAPVFGCDWSRIWEAFGKDMGWPLGADLDDPFLGDSFRTLRHMHESQLHRLPDVAEGLARLTGEHLEDLAKLLKWYAKLDAPRRTAMTATARNFARIGTP